LQNLQCTSPRSINNLSGTMGYIPAEQGVALSSWPAMWSCRWRRSLQAAARSSSSPGGASASSMWAASFCPGQPLSPPDESFDFLGYTMGRYYSAKTGKSYIGTCPSKKKVNSLCRELSEMTSRRGTLLPVEEKVSEINRRLTGWSNYFCLVPVSKAYRAVDRHVCRRLRQWLCVKHKVGSRGTSRYPDEYLHGNLGLIKLPERTCSFSTFSRVGRLTPISSAFTACFALSLSQSPFAPPALPGFFTTTGPSATPNDPACSSRSFSCGPC
jgi:hypothetical protein